MFYERKGGFWLYAALPVALVGIILTALGLIGLLAPERIGFRQELTVQGIFAFSLLYGLLMFYALSIWTKTIGVKGDTVTLETFILNKKEIKDVKRLLLSRYGLSVYYNGTKKPTYIAEPDNFNDSDRMLKDIERALGKKIEAYDPTKPGMPPSFGMVIESHKRRLVEKLPFVGKK